MRCPQVLVYESDGRLAGLLRELIEDGEMVPARNSAAWCRSISPGPRWAECAGPTARP